MKLLTINTHSLIEKDYENKLLQFVTMIAKEQPDIFAMQEVNQSVTAPVCPDKELKGFVRDPAYTLPIRADNHAARVAGLLQQNDLCYEWTYISVKLGYEKYDEGIALFSLHPITQTKQFLVSRTDDYTNWKTRRCLAVSVQGMENRLFCSVHMGWWDDGEEPFSDQWKHLLSGLEEELKDKQVWLMGDFNAQPNGPSYECICDADWKDCYQLAAQKDDGITVDGVIDGWRDRVNQTKESGQPENGMRLDYIFCNQNVPVISSSVVCNGKNYPKVSDHYGVMTVVDEQISL